MYVQHTACRKPFLNQKPVFLFKSLLCWWVEGGIIDKLGISVLAVRFTLRNTSNLLLKRNAGSSVFGLMEGRSCYIHSIRMAKCEEMASKMVQIHSSSLCSPMGFISQVFRALLCPTNTDSGLALPRALCSVLLATHGGLRELLFGRSIETISQMESGVDADGNSSAAGIRGQGPSRHANSPQRDNLFSQEPWGVGRGGGQPTGGRWAELDFSRQLRMEERRLLLHARRDTLLLGFSHWKQTAGWSLKGTAQECACSS